MKDIPMFQSEYGIASLVLKEIPYLQKAYVKIQASQDPEKLVQECLSFCRMCGAEQVYFSGHAYLERYPLYTEMWYMQICKESLEDTEAALWPVLPENLKYWQEIYNEKVKKVPNGAWMTDQDAKKMLEQGDGYFIHKNGKLLGIGRASADIIDWVASVEPGAGRQIVSALTHAVTQDSVRLLVASANEKAMKLYQTLGFVPTGRLSCWYHVTSEK